jgi:sugar/nucleoside kinase (ribokinase family)
MAALRSALGQHPVVAVTAGAAGLWLSIGSDEQLLAAPRVVTGRPTVGAGDMLAALLLMGITDAEPDVAARAAMQQVSELLAHREMAGA